MATSSHIDKLWNTIKQLKSESEVTDFIDKLSPDEIHQLRTRSNPYKEPIVKSNHGFLIFSIINYKDIFHRQLLQVGFIEFVKQALIEYIPPDADTYKSETSSDFMQRYKKNILLHLVDRNKNDKNQLYSLYKKMGLSELYIELEEQGAVLEEIDTEISESTADTIIELTKKELDIDITREEYIELKQNEIRKFLDTQLGFSDILQNNDELQRRRLHRNLCTYIDANYDRLKTKTEDTYSTTCDIEYVIIPRDVVNSIDEYEEYKNKYATEFDLDILCARFNIFNCLAPIGANRDRLEFYNKNTAILEQMINETQKDMNIGKDMLLQRMKKNNQPSAQATESFEKYMEQFNRMDSLNVKSMHELHKEISKDKSDPTISEVEVDVNVIKPVIKPDAPITRGLSHRYHYNL